MFRSKILEPFDLLRHSKKSVATIIDGKAIANKTLDNLKTAVQLYKEKKHRVPFLSAILVGDNPASKVYVKNKVSAAHFVGIETQVLNFPSSVKESHLKETIQLLNNSEEVDSILIQLPLPSHINTQICETISPEKDVDGFTSVNFGKFCLGQESLVPCTALAVQKILHEIGVNIAGKNVLVCGRSKHVGLPIAIILHSSCKSSGFNANTVICHRFTPEKQLKEFCQNADVVISATGVPSLIRGHMVKKDSIVIDVGISRIVEPGSLKENIVGDVNFEEVKKIAGFITPVPGGVGPLTVAMLLHNTLTIAQRRK